jgi:DNA repair protein RadA/Sms
MAKVKKMYQCTACKEISAMWMGKCSSCGEWDSLVLRMSEKAQATPNVAANFATSIASSIEHYGGVSEAIQILEVDTPTVGRMSTGISELDRVLGGGLVLGSVALVGGEPGIGKSTLMMQAAIGAASQGKRVLYATSEESAYQCKLRAERLLHCEQVGECGLSTLFVLAGTDLAQITKQVLEIKPDFLVVDSIQMVYRSDMESAPGSVSQIRRCCLELVYLARQLQLPIMIVGHVTKDGQLAGPRVLEHLVDVVLNFEGDRHYALRGLRGIKNRFGTTLEIGLFEMGQQGLQEVVDAASFLDPDAPPRAGAVVCPAMHGSRCLLIETQALVTQGTIGQARRRASGLDGNRFTMLTAVLEQHAHLKLADQDIYVSTVGGLKLTEPAVDLALCLAIIGAYNGLIVQKGVCAIGEVGLGGELRTVAQMEQRVAQARRRGYKHILVPITQVEIAGKNSIGVASIADLGSFFEKKEDIKAAYSVLSGSKKNGIIKCA